VTPTLEHEFDVTPTIDTRT